MQGRLHTKGQSLGWRGGFRYQHTLSKSQTIDTDRLFFFPPRPLTTYAMREKPFPFYFIYLLRVNYSKWVMLKKQMWAVAPFSRLFLVVCLLLSYIYLFFSPLCTLITTQVRRGREPHRLLPAVARRAPHRLQAGLHVRKNWSKSR